MNFCKLVNSPLHDQIDNLRANLQARESSQKLCKSFGGE